jgi:hypothetical protein
MNYPRSQLVDIIKVLLYVLFYSYPQVLVNLLLGNSSHFTTIVHGMIERRYVHRERLGDGDLFLLHAGNVNPFIMATRVCTRN